MKRAGHVENCACDKNGRDPDCAPMKRKPKVGWCAQCGPLSAEALDEDGCCQVCGADSTGKGAEMALRLLKRADPRRDAVVKAAVKAAESIKGRYYGSALTDLLAAVEKMQGGGK